MNEWLRKNLAKLRENWAKWTVLQKAIVGGIVAVIIIAIVLMVTMSSRPSTTRLFNAPVNDESERERIVTRLDQDNVKAYVDSNNYISVENAEIAKHYRSKLIAEGYTPSHMDAYSLFDVTRWSRNDFDDAVNWKRSMEKAVKQHLEALDGIDRAEVILTIPEETLLSSNQNPTSASVILYAKSGSDVLEDKKQIKGIQTLVMRGVEGLREEYVTIVDGNTNLQINDFEGMAEADRLSRIERENRIRRKEGAEIASRVLEQLQGTYSKRVRVVNVEVEIDMSEKTSESKEYSGIQIRPDNPNTPYDDSEIVESLTLSEETVNKSFTGTGYNPEGPAGIEGQNPPVYSDMSNVIGKSTEEGVKRNYALNEKNTSEITSPQPGRRTVSVNIDGKWDKAYDIERNHVKFENGHIVRTYEPISEHDLNEVIRLVQGAVGYDKARGDVVIVTNVPFDHSEEFEKEDKAYIAAYQRNRTIMFSLLGIAIILVAFILFRIISRSIERRRRLAEEERIRRQEAERQAALLAAQQEGMEVTMSVEERKRAELQENAVAMAKEHPEDVAMLLRTWLMEE